MRYSSLRPMRPAIWVLASALVLLLTGMVQAGSGLIEPFVGEYKGSAEVINADGSSTPRDMSVEIGETKDGFNVTWSSTTYKPDGRTKEKSYSVDFLPTDRAGVFSAAMKRNVFGHATQLDPMKGEPYVWGQIVSDTLTVYNLFIDATGGYELQQFDRTITEGGLMLAFSRLSNGKEARTVETFLEKQ
ncbi:hypothetical protein [Falsiruegeria mediterranea]|jgi:hypothetical protein|uniref:Uncharacterized protein n=2 Tax=Falsiruegeria TaxID=2854184 RepID=A0A2R8C8K0_9RHOB|nr:hypothetical protein [Falsiruegeria mediterranea]SPJ28732.1 hypothetical protein TRM7615_02237 [Falsiruegeria mediterranea M17]